MRRLTTAVLICLPLVLPIVLAAQRRPVLSISVEGQAKVFLDSVANAAQDHDVATAGCVTLYTVFGTQLIVSRIERAGDGTNEQYKCSPSNPTIYTSTLTASPRYPTDAERRQWRERGFGWLLLIVNDSGTWLLTTY